MIQRLLIGYGGTENQANGNTKASQKSKLQEATGTTRARERREEIRIIKTQKFSREGKRAGMQSSEESHW